LSNSKSFLSHPQNRNLQPDIIHPYSSHSKIQIHFIETPDWTLSGSPSDIVWNLNLSPTASFLRELYKYTSTSNG
jgi:hypothetical protein